MQKTDGTEDREIKGIMFDMDNTLFDLVEAKIASCEAIVDYIGTGDPEELLMYFLRPDHGFESLENIRDYLKDIDFYCEAVFEICCRLYSETKLGTIQLYPDVVETLKLLREQNIDLFIVTDASHANAHARLEKLSLSEMFDHIITSDMTGLNKPDIRVFHHALLRAKLRAEEVLFVGDSQRMDIDPAGKAGMMTAYASYGDRNINEPYNVKADYILNNIKDIFNVKGISKNQV